jgi:hypothetical protein
MSSESPSAAARERLADLIGACFPHDDVCDSWLNDPDKDCDCDHSDRAFNAVLAVLPALADEIERLIVKARNTPMFYRSEGMYAAARHLRSLVAAPADDPKL